MRRAEAGARSAARRSGERAMTKLSVGKLALCCNVTIVIVILLLLLLHYFRYSDAPTV